MSSHIRLVTPRGLLLIVSLLIAIGWPNPSKADPEVQFQLPMRGKVSVIGYLPGQQDHVGIDYWAVDLRSDDPRVFPAAPGVVVYAGFDCSLKLTEKDPPPSIPAPGNEQCILPPLRNVYGNTVVIAHGDGLYSIYTHLESAEMGKAKLNQTVTTDDQIGVMWHSGCPDCPDHLHFAIRRDTSLSEHSGTPILTGRPALWNNAFEAVNAWEVVKGLPNPPRTGDIPAGSVPPAPGQAGTPAPSQPGETQPHQLKFSILIPFGWWVTVYACGEGYAPVRLDGKTVLERTPGQASIRVGAGNHTLEWAGNGVSVNFVWSPLSPPACPAPAPALPPAASLLAESSAAMRALPRIEVQAQANLLFMRGSGQLKLVMPDGVEGQWEGLGQSVHLLPNQGGTAVIVNGRHRGYLPAKGAASAVRDSMLDLLTYVSKWQVKQEGSSYHLEGQLPRDMVQTLTRTLGVDVPGDPHGQMMLAIDTRSKVWQRLELKVTWALASLSLFGQEIELGPSGNMSVAFR